MKSVYAVLAMFAITAAGSAAEPTTPCPAPVPGWKAPEPGEHPRLFFRKADLPALRQRAATPEGKAIIERLKAMLGGGEALPTSYRPDKTGSDDGAGKFPLGTFTFSHPAGFGFLYQITGDKKYAELARECAQKVLDGQRDIDNRYSYIRPYSTIRGGPPLAAMAMAYDLCYDAWPAEFRQQIAVGLQTYHQVGDKASRHKVSDIREFALKPNMPPESNHFCPNVGGAGIALLAIKGDPGVDNKLVDELLAGVEKNIIVAMEKGHGETGFFMEGQGAGQIASDTIFVPMLQAMQVAGGKDFITPRTDIQWLALRWPMWLISKGGVPYYQLLRPSSYGSDLFDRGGVSRGGQFAQGFGLLNDQQKAAMLWTYRNIVEPQEAAHYKQYLPKGEKSYDALVYPHRAMLALVNWPIGIEPKNPETVLPKAVGDKRLGYYVMRNRWKDDSDIIVSALLGARDGQPIAVWGLGKRATFGAVGKGNATLWKSAPDGSAVLSTATGSMAVDFSKASGAEAIVAVTGAGAQPAAGDFKSVTLTLGDKPVQVLVIASGAAPEPKVDGDKIVIGGQTITLKDGNLVLGKM